MALRGGEQSRLNSPQIFVENLAQREIFVISVNDLCTSQEHIGTPVVNALVSDCGYDCFDLYLYSSPQAESDTSFSVFPSDREEAS